MKKNTKPKENLKIRDFNRRIPTNENWAGTYDDGTCEAYCFVMKPHLGIKNFWFRIGFRGNDDMCMEYDFEGTRMECIDKFNDWVKYLNNCTLITFQLLKDKGLNFA
jgi:hypothetical protein